jgi:hypothetical protein
MHRQPHILSASTNLLGICFIVIGGLKLTNSNSRSYADEVAWVAAVLLFVSTMNSYLAIRSNGAHGWQAQLADWTFMGGVVCLAASIVIGATYL